MATYGGMANRIISEIARSDTSITADVQAQILSAIEFYASQRFWFNEKESTITTSSSLAVYAFPADMQQIDSVVMWDSSGTKIDLGPKTFHEINGMDSGRDFGKPSWYATYAQQFRLYPVPNGTFTFVVSHQYRIATLSASTDTNAWTNEAESLIRARATKLLHAIKFKDPESASVCEEWERQELERLRMQTEKLLDTGVLRGSGF